MNLSEIKTYEDICKIDGVDPIKSLPIQDPQTPEEVAINSFSKIIRINRVLNKGWKPNWNDFSERKYYPYFDMETYDDNPGSSSRFSYNDYNYDNDNSNVSAHIAYTKIIYQYEPCPLAKNNK